MEKRKNKDETKGLDYRTVKVKMITPAVKTGLFVGLNKGHVVTRFLAKGLWVVRTGKIVHTLETKSLVTSDEVSQDGWYITTPDGSTVKFWDANQ